MCSQTVLEKETSFLTPVTIIKRPKSSPRIFILEKVESFILYLNQAIKYIYEDCKVGIHGDYIID